MMALCLIFVQSVNVHAESAACASVGELSILLDGVDSIVAQLEELGLSVTDINELLELSPREPGFYDTSEKEIIPYDGSFAVDASSCISDICGNIEGGITPYGTNAYDGNPPENSQIQRKRIEDIYGTALQYYNTDYYEGRTRSDEYHEKEEEAKTEKRRFGRYLTYLYLSHYIDGPGRIPTDAELPHIISGSDVNAYEQFIAYSRTAKWATSVADLGAALYSDYDYIKYLNALHTVDQKLQDTRTQIGVTVGIATNPYYTTKALKTIAPMIKTGLILNYATTSNEAELTQETSDYVSSELYTLNFYNQYDKNITDTLTGILISAFISITLNSISLLGASVAAIPLYVYNVSEIIQTASLVTLQSTFSPRYAIRTAILIDLEDF